MEGREVQGSPWARFWRQGRLFGQTLVEMVRDIYVLGLAGPERRAMTIALALAFFNQAIASSAIVNYAPEVLNSIGVSSPTTATALTSGVTLAKVPAPLCLHACLLARCWISACVWGGRRVGACASTGVSCLLHEKVYNRGLVWTGGRGVRGGEGRAGDGSVGVHSTGGPGGPAPAAGVGQPGLLPGHVGGGPGSHLSGLLACPAGHGHLHVCLLLFARRRVLGCDKRNILHVGQKRGRVRCHGHPLSCR